MTSWAKPGVKVVCVSWTDWKSNELSWIPLEIGKVYTIRDVWMGKKRDGEKVVAVRLDEITNMTNSVGTELGYHLSSFQPLIDKKLPASLTSILENPRRGIKNDKFDKSKRFEPV